MRLYENTEVRRGRRKEERRRKTHNELERRLETSSEGVSSVVRLVEHVVEASEDVLESRLGLDEVDEDVVGHGEENVVEVADDEELRSFALRIDSNRQPKAERRRRGESAP